jgi:hypothetical protein
MSRFWDLGFTRALQTQKPVKPPRVSKTTQHIHFKRDKVFQKSSKLVIVNLLFFKQSQTLTEEKTSHPYQSNLFHLMHLIHLTDLMHMKTAHS